MTDQSNRLAKLLVPVKKFAEITRPYYVVPGIAGHVLFTQMLGRHISDFWQGFGVLYPQFLDDEPEAKTIEAIAARMCESIMRVQPEGPYRLVGYSMGGFVCLEVARKLGSLGHRSNLTLLDVRLFDHAPLKPFFQRIPIKAFWMTRERLLRVWGNTKFNERREMERRLYHAGELAAQKAMLPAFERASRDGHAALDAYKLSPCPSISAVLIRCRENAWWDTLRTWPDDYGWSNYVQVVDVLHAPGDHVSMLRAQNLKALGGLLEQSFRALDDVNPPSSLLRGGVNRMVRVQPT